MTVGAIVRKAGPYNYSSGASYPFYFKVFAASDVVVTKTDVIGSEETLTYSDDYTVSINNDQDSTPGGSVSLVTSFTTSDKITISSAVPATQETVITNQGGFYPDTLNKAFDKLTILCQQSSEELSRCVKVNISSGENPKTLIDSIHTDSLAAIQSAASASTSESAAAESETAAATSEANAAASATAALASQNAASESETNAAASATSASNTLTQMQAAYTGINAINTAVSGASASANAAAASATAASGSASAAGTSETNAATSEANAAASETAAETSAASALTSRNEAAASQIAAATSEANAAISESSASQSAAQAALSAEQAAAGQVNTDWNATSGKAQILNKPVLSAVASSGQYDDLSGKPDLSVYATNTSVTNGLAGKSDSGHVHSFAALTDKPDTLAGYGVAVDAVPTEGSANPVTSDGVKTAIDAKDALPAQAGNADKFLKTDGTQASWESVVVSHGMQVFTESGTFTVPEGITQVDVRLCGAGGGGAFRKGTAGSETVTAGAGGATSFGTYATATGGSGGSAGSYPSVAGGTPNGVPASPNVFAGAMCNFLGTFGCGGDGHLPSSGYATGGSAGGVICGGYSVNPGEVIQVTVGVGGTPYSSGTYGYPGICIVRW